VHRNVCHDDNITERYYLPTYLARGISGTL
jgi:hypothetical protein